MKLSVLTLLAVLCFSSAASADDWAVNSTRDALDMSPGDGRCWTGDTLPDGALECTLRAVLQEVNIRYAVSGLHIVYVPAGVYRLTLRTVEPSEEDERQWLLEWSADQAIVTGDLDIDASVTITGEGEGRTIISGESMDRVVEVVGGAYVTLQDLTLERGVTRTGFGGCLFSQNYSTLLTLNRLTIQDCRAEGRQGGGMYNGGVVHMERVTFRRNQAGRGGGLYNDGVARINESTFDRNLASFETYAGDGGGGGIANLAIQGAAPHLELTNSTLWNNSAADGGGLLNRGRASLSNVTVSGNNAGRGAGIAFDEAASPAAVGTEILLIRYSTIARNFGRLDAGISRTSLQPLTLSHVLLSRNSMSGTSGFNCSGPVTSSDHTIEDANSCGLTGVGDRIDTLPLLFPLADNGGPTRTHALMPGSPAIDAGVVVPAEWLDRRDQRGVPRPLGSATDVGAFEFGIDPRTLWLLVPVRLTRLFPDATPGMTIPYLIVLSLDTGAPPKKGADSAAIMGIKAGDLQGQLQFDLDKSGRKVTVKGVAMGLQPSDNPDLGKQKNGGVLFYVEVRRPIHGAARLRIDELTCECDTRVGKPAPLVIPPYKPKGK